MFEMVKKELDLVIDEDAHLDGVEVYKIRDKEDEIEEKDQIWVMDYLGHARRVR